MEYTELWTSSEVNKYLFQELKKLCQLQGFILSPKKKKKLVRVKEHYIEIIFPEIVYYNTKIHMQIAPTTTYQDCYCFDKKVILRKSNDMSVAKNYYSSLAIMDKSSSKLYYDPNIIKKVWNDVIAPQLQETVISYFDQFSFDDYVSLAQQGTDGVLSYCHSPGMDDVLRFLSMAHSEIWRGNYEEGAALLKRAISGYSKSIHHAFVFHREIDEGDQKDYESSLELLSIIENRKADITNSLYDKLNDLEQTALQAVWGVGLTSEGNTVKLKQK